MKILREIVDEFSKKSWVVLCAFEFIFITCILGVLINDLVTEKTGIQPITIIIILVCIIGIMLDILSQLKKYKANNVKNIKSMKRKSYGMVK
jgi:uncharacterized protein YqhQ